MIIYLPINDLLYELFPDAKDQGEDALIQAVRQFYAVQDIEPEVSVTNGLIEIRLVADHMDERAFERGVGLCLQGRYDEGKEIFEKLAKSNPTNSEVHRILGQIASEQGEQEVAIDHLIDALRWDPKNTHALTMMGNIQARHRRDVDTAMKYYEASLEVNPKDHLAANNIAAQFLNMEKWDLAETWFEKAMAIEPNHPNTHHGLGVVSNHKGDAASALFEFTEALRLNPKRDQLYRESLSAARFVAVDMVDNGVGAEVAPRMCAELAKETGKPVRSVADEDIPTAARLELAETYGREEHVVRYKPSYRCVEHLEVHELYHLRYITEARNVGLNELFTSGPKNKDAFLQAHAKDRARMIKSGISEQATDGFLLNVFNGMNLQVYNAPIDLFIEYDMHRDHPEMRPYQLLSLEGLINEGIQATTDKRIVDIAPSDILSKSKVYSMTLAMLYQELFGVDRLTEFDPSGLERQQAQRLYAEFKEYRDDREPAEEYEVVRHWAEDLKLTPYFALVKEEEHWAKAGVPLDEQLDSIEADPLDLRNTSPEREREMKTFQEGQAAIGTNMAVVMFMVDALKYFKAQPMDKVKQTAIEIAMLGTQGIYPENQGYKLAHVPGKTFSGYHLLAYYYVSFKLALPEMLKDLQLPYDSEYAMAEQLYTATP